MKRKGLSFLFLLLPILVSAQQKGIVMGKVTDERGKPLELVNIALKGSPGGITTDFRGRYELQLKADTTYTLLFSFIGYLQSSQKVSVKFGETAVLDVTLVTISTTLPLAEV
ncbi:MAG: carboxypeptidase-like regulatory domain-containing protein, partial [Ignavibacteria bacterium]|nr:carboxypeptidase-like regulatory domain-containing protein [Ignavibacteria bacterium]